MTFTYHNSNGQLGSLKYLGAYEEASLGCTSDKWDK